jgi:hypothetical protein
VKIQLKLDAMEVYISNSEEFGVIDTDAMQNSLIK